MSENMSTKKKFLFKIVGIILVFFVLETTGWIILKFIKPYYAVARKIMLGSQKDFIVRGQASVPQPYLLYIPAPHFVSNGVVQHNEHGYRGEKVPLRRKPNTTRILFMGGSTTYGQKVKRPEDSFPAQVGKILSQKHKDRLGEVEVINAGIPFGTSAEILTHYHFKYRYYKPDLVVINTGGNDANAIVRGNYQPDYSNWRKNMIRFRPLRKHSRWLMYSRFASVVIINLFFSDLFSENWFVEDRYPVAPWYETKQEGRIEKFPEISDEELAFYVNLNAVIRGIKADGAKILLVPFRAANPSEYTESFRKEFLRNEDILKRLSKEHAVPFIPFPANIISKEESWVDFCHLNEEGTREKAQYIAAYVYKLLLEEKK